MSKTITATADRGSELRALSDNEVDNVNGGLIALPAIGLGILFMWGMIAGDCAWDVYHGAEGAPIPEGVGLGA